MFRPQEKKSDKINLKFTQSRRKTKPQLAIANEWMFLLTLLRVITPIHQYRNDAGPSFRRNVRVYFFAEWVNRDSIDWKSNERSRHDKQPQSQHEKKKKTTLNLLCVCSWLFRRGLLSVAVLSFLICTTIGCIVFSTVIVSIGIFFSLLRSLSLSR